MTAARSAFDGGLRVRSSPAILEHPAQQHPQPRARRAGALAESESLPQLGR